MRNGYHLTELDHTREALFEYYYVLWVPKETNPPLVLKSLKSSPLNSGGGMGDQVQGGALAHASELPTSMSSCQYIPLSLQIELISIL